jgi:tRNA threonylcarbamoyl adenosine modification protein YjeE
MDQTNQKAKIIKDYLSTRPPEEPSDLWTGTLENLNELVLPLAQTLQSHPGSWIFLNGDLGSGKTTLVQRLAQQLWAQDRFESPTYTLMHSVMCHTQALPIKNLIHLDLYRLKQGQELCYLGLEMEFDPKHSLVFWEWGDLIDNHSYQEFFRLTGCEPPVQSFEIHIVSSGIQERRYSIQTRPL